LLRHWDGRRLEGRGSLLLLCLRTEEIPQRRVEDIDLVADLRERPRPVEAALNGLDLGVVAVDRDEVEATVARAEGLARFDHSHAAGAH
jgi:hypothetical protein